MSALAGCRQGIDWHHVCGKGAGTLRPGAAAAFMRRHNSVWIDHGYDRNAGRCRRARHQPGRQGRRRYRGGAWHRSRLRGGAGGGGRRGGGRHRHRRAGQRDPRLRAGHAAGARRDRALVEAAGARWLPIQLDQRNLRALRQAATSIEAGFGGIDVLFANAGIQAFKPLLEMNDPDWHDQIDVNLTGHRQRAQGVRAGAGAARRRAHHHHLVDAGAARDQERRRPTRRRSGA